MNDRFDDALARALHDRMESVDVPPADVGVIAARSAAAPPRSQRAWLRIPATAAAAAALVCAAYATTNNVRAGGGTLGERIADSMRQAFHAAGLPEPSASIGVSPVWRRVSLDEARRDAGFPIVAPSELPDGYRLKAVDVGTHRGADAVQLTFRRPGISPRTPSSIQLIERATRPTDGPRDSSGGVAADLREDGTLRHAHRVGPSRIVTSSFDVNGTYVQTILLDVPNAPEKARDVKSALLSGPR